jgi:hypothetical protein
VDGSAVHASIVTGSDFVPDDLAAKDHRVGFDFVPDDLAAKDHRLRFRSG